MQLLCSTITSTFEFINQSAHAIAHASPIPSPSGPAGLSRTGSISFSPRAAAPILFMRAKSIGNGESDSSSNDIGIVDMTDVAESAEARERELIRRRDRIAHKHHTESSILERYGWILSDDDDWLLIDRRLINEVSMSDDILNDRRLSIFSSLSYPTCLLFSNRATQMSLSDIDLDGVLSSAGGGERGLRIAKTIIQTLDRKGVKFNELDELTMDIAKRWQQRKTVQLLEF